MRILLAGRLAIVLIPAEVLENHGVSIARLTSVSDAIGVVLRAVGEEVFFRGLRGEGGWSGGSASSGETWCKPCCSSSRIFILLLMDARLWPLLPVQFATGWLLGWLRHKTGTFVPGAVVHVLANIAAGLITL